MRVRVHNGIRCLMLALAMGIVGPAQAWSNHALCTGPALAMMPEVAARSPVAVQSLAGFIGADPAALARLLADEEAWARQHVPAYPPRPEALAFTAEAAPAAEFVRRFVAAVRIN